MSNILIIKHGSLGDIAQISGVLKDLRLTHKNDSIYILTTPRYKNLFLTCPFVDNVLIDKRLPRWNILYLFQLKKKISKISFKKIYDLQNSSRTSFYRKFLFTKYEWSSSETILESDETKSQFDSEPVLKRFETQLIKSGVKPIHCIEPDFNWACINIDKYIKKLSLDKYILLFPFCSKGNEQKRWPYYNELIKIIKSKHRNIMIIVIPGPNEIEEAKKINAISILDEGKNLNIMELAGLIKKAVYVISNDTGPAHITAHLQTNGITLFGSHTSPLKVSIESKNFKALVSKDLTKLTAEEVYLKVKKYLE